VAILVRVAAPARDYDAPSFMESTAAAQSTPDTTQLLYIKRAVYEGDRWSGHVAFPGGKADAGDADDGATAVREAREELGIDLEAAGWQLLGTLQSTAVRGGAGTGGRRRGAFGVTPVVYVQCVPRTPVLTLPARGEVAAARWVTVSSILRVAAEDGWIDDGIGFSPASCVPFHLSGRLPPALTKVGGALGLDPVVCRAIPLDPAPPYEVDGDVTAADSDIVASPADDAAAAAAAAAPPPTPAEPVSFQLWGMSLGMTAELLSRAGARRRIDWPPIGFRSPVWRTLLGAVSGVTEVVDVLRGGTAWRDTTPAHMRALFGVVAALVATMAAAVMLSGGGGSPKP